MNMSAQDTIIKNNGVVIYANIIEVGTNAISFKKNNFLDGPTFIENKTDISLIKYRNGQQQEFVRVEIPKITNSEPVMDNGSRNDNNGNNTYNNNNKNYQSTSNPNTALKNGPVNDRKIEEIDGKYLINGQKIGRHALDKELKKSKDPLVQSSLKTAKLLKISQKIVGITSYGSTMAGGITSIAMISQFITAYQTGVLGPTYYFNAGISLLGTVSLPITSKVLKKQRDKLYGKTIDLYNAGY